ncbi:patronin isoform X4 [Aphidius gifuensis]|uniref:patronin isoform X4 n=1 Tax=Aphidius gifuensis TaxID=684658 RepID=UPI001CDCF7F6|nr:patronin isoform X4 [Aphidius gifuensis]
MWSTISRLFVAKSRSSTKTLEQVDNNCVDNINKLSFVNNYYNEDRDINNLTQDHTNLAVHVFDSMDRNMGDDRRRDSKQSATDANETRQAKQRASVKWLLSKAFNNRVPDNLHEPYYRDHEDQEHLKPQIVQSLSNAELYCLALANIYSDPNYHNQNHWGILQALARKGVYVSDPNNTTLTETILIQNSPLKMSAHMAVIEGLMVLYAKEVVTSDRVVAAIKRFNPQAHIDIPNDHEKGLLLWISHASNALIIKIKQNNDDDDNDTIIDEHKKLPELPDTKDFQSLCDGVGLAAVIAFYCPNELNWKNIKVSKRPSVADALHNLSLVHSFCMRCLPYSIFHMQPEDVTYMRGSMKQNLVVFLADMYNVLEIHPVKCVRYPGGERAMQYLDACPRNSHGVAHKRSLPQSITPIPDLRSNLSVSAPGFTVAKTSAPISVRKSQSLHQTAESHSYDDRRGGSEENFVIHRNKGIPTLSSVTDDKLIKFEAAGRPSNWEDQRRSSYAGRRSRRNSVTDDSQLTIENFGGSQDNLQNFGCIRNPDKEMVVHSGKRVAIEPTIPIRTMMQDVYGSDVQNILADNGYSNDEPTKTPRLRRQMSNTNINNSSTPIKNILHSIDNDDNNNDDIDDDNKVKKMASFATYGKQNTDNNSNFKLVERNKDDSIANKSNFTINKHEQSNGNGIGNNEKKTTFATLSNTTTWQQQYAQQSQQLEQNTKVENGGSSVEPSQSNDIKLQLEERKRRIANEKRKAAVEKTNIRQDVHKTAFLQAVTKGKVKSPSSSTSGGDSPVEHAPPTPMSSSGGGGGGGGVDKSSSINSTLTHPQQTVQDKPQRPFSLKESGEDVRDIENKWRDQDGTVPFIETRRTPDIENMDREQYHQSITHRNYLSDMQAEIKRLATQQNQIQQQHIMTQHQQQMQQQLQQQIQIQSLNQQHMQNYTLPPQVNSMTQRLPDNHQGQFYLHDQPAQIQRRTWARPPSQNNDMTQINFQQSMDPRFAPQPVYQQDPRNIYQDTRTWGSPITPQKGFVLHDNIQDQRYLNGGGVSGGEHSLQNNQIHHSQNYPVSGNIYQSTATSASPQHRNAVHRISQLINESPEVKKQSIVHHIPITCDNTIDKRHNNAQIHTSVPAPPVDDMEPQNISFIGNDDDAVSQGIRHLNITSGSRTYRIPSPTKPTSTTPTISRNSFQPHGGTLRESVSPLPPVEIKPLDQTNETNEKGFYISFDSDTPKKPKPTLRVKRSPKKERTVSSFIENEDFTRRPESPPINSAERQRHIEAQRDLERERQRQADEREQQRQDMRDRELQREIIKERQQREGTTATTTTTTNDENRTSGVGLVIGNQLSNLDPNSIDEMERKKEKIMMLSLQRRQQQEELKERKEAEIQARRDKEKMKEEERARKKEEDRQRRAIILEQHKLKKAIEEAEREGKVIDKELLNAIKPTPKLRNKTVSARQRPKTIHVDHSSELDSGTLTPSRGKKGSSSNLSTASLTSPTMKRDYFRGSQDTLISAHSDDRRGGPFYRGGSLKVSSVDSPDDGRGCSPYRSTTQLGRRGSYKTSRDTDSGLGRATPPRRAPSPGMGSTKHLPSPSGPGSLPPGLMSKRKFDDGSSDISSTASSMMDYNGPRLYKQPTTKSNRGIMLNAVEYCVFPGSVNKDAKRRVLDEIARSESKHFLILFRDAGCQFRALYSYCPDGEEITKLCGTGPKQVLDNMFDRFFKYNSGGKCFSQVHTKHLTVTIDAFTIHNSLWQGKKVNLPNKKDMALVI